MKTGDLLNLDITALNHELDRTKSQVFMGKSAAFLGSLMCNLEFIWDEDTDTAATDGANLWWNPQFYMALSPATRKTVLVHELWHPARLHMLRKGLRDHKIWNYACDLWINNGLEDEGYSFVGIEWCWKDQQYRGMVEEDIYDLLIQNNVQPPPAPFGQPNEQQVDMREPEKANPHTLISNVVKAIQQAKASGQGAGSVPGGIEKIIERFLAPVIPWEIELQKFCTDLQNEDYTWSRPNRRHQDIYLPSKFMDDGRLEHLCYYLDVSGSCSDADVLRFNSEVKFIKETLNPQKLTVIQFTTEICDERVFLESDPFEVVFRKGTGGTSLVPVREHMLKHRPTAAIVFSDLQCRAMDPLPFDVPTIWVAIRASGKSVPFGRLIHIRN